MVRHVNNVALVRTVLVVQQPVVARVLDVRSIVLLVHRRAARYLRVTTPLAATAVTTTVLVRASVPAAHGVHLVYRTSAAV